jgi:hypothetical protein
MDAQPLARIAKQFHDIADVIAKMAANAEKAPAEASGNTQALGAINRSLTQILAALKSIASGR